MTGNEALKVANAFARIHQQVSHKVFSLLFPSKLKNKNISASHPLQQQPNDLSAF
jgi:hypothetical protein